MSTPAQAPVKRSSAARAAAAAAFTADPPASTDTSAWTRVPGGGVLAQTTSTITSPTATNRVRGSDGRPAPRRREYLIDLGCSEQMRDAIQRTGKIEVEFG